MRPQLPPEAERGIEYLKGIVESGKILKLGEPRPAYYGSGSSVLLGLSAMEKNYDLCLTREQLADLPGTKEYRDSANVLARSLDNRINNVDPNLFMTRSGRLLHLRIEWPMQPWYNEQRQLTAARFVWVIVTDHITKELARCRYKITSMQLMLRYGPDPFNQYETITNSVRAAVDSGTVVFYPSAEEHPEPVSGNIIELTEMKPIEADEAIKQFLMEKVWFLAFKSGGPNSVTWIGDSWDASYLGRTSLQLLQQSAVLDAQKKIALTESGRFASAGQTLLASDGPTRVTGPGPSPAIRQFRTALDSYALGECLGEGGSGRVFEATDEDGNIFALKYLKPEVRSKLKARRFKNEMGFCMKSNHRNLVRVLDHGLTLMSEVEVPFYVMPLYQKTLRTVMREESEPRKLLSIFQQILDGVSAAHAQGIWHRDLKPENILYDPTTEQVVVSDFGVAHFQEELLHTFVETRPGERLANFRYAAPEQVSDGPVDHRADIYALGLILYELLTGELLRGTGHRTIASSSPGLACLDPLIEKMTRQRPSERHPSTNEVQDELLNCIAKIGEHS
jgi:hypothetical protein